jgi:imidazoleglycerol-phosphate dehydratase
VTEHTAAGVRLGVHGRGLAHVETGLPVLNGLLALLAETARFDLDLDVEPGDAEAEVDAAGAALGAALAGPLRVGGVRGYGSKALPSAEALAQVVLERSDDPLFVTNVDLTDAHVGGLGTDVARRFLETLADHAGLVLHVRLLDGTDSAHVLEAIFKALGAALCQACEPIGGTE